MIISTILVWLGLWSGAYGQSFTTVNNSQTVTPNYAPAQRGPATGVIPVTHVVPVVYQPAQPKNVAPQPRAQVEETADIYVRTEFPGPQRLFTRESEAQFFDRIRQEVKRTPGAGAAIFPEEARISKSWYTQPSYPRLDPIDKQPFAHMTELVEPSYVCHRRLLFEQPNFERIGWNFGILQPGLHLTTFYYDLAMLPYHVSSDFRNRGECSVAKCLPGDPAPFTVPIERFSVTGIIGQAGAIIGGNYLFPH